MGRQKRIRPNVRSIKHLETPGPTTQTALNRRLYNEVERHIDKNPTWRVRERQLQEFAGWLVYGEGQMPDALDSSMATAVRKSLLGLLEELGWPQGLKEELEGRLGISAGSKSTEAKPTKTAEVKNAPSNPSFDLYAEVDRLIRRYGWGDKQSQLAKNYIRSLAEGNGSRDKSMRVPVQTAIVRTFYAHCVKKGLPVSANLKEAIVETFCRQLQDKIDKAAYGEKVWTGTEKATALNYGWLLAKDGKTKPSGPTRPAKLPPAIAEKVEQLFVSCYSYLEDLLQGRYVPPGQYCPWFLESLKKARNAQRR